MPLDSVHAGGMRRLADAVLGSPGAVEPTVRRAVEDRAARLSGRTGGTPLEVHGSLQGYVEKIARAAFAVTDGDVTALRDAGWSEDAIFEVTLAAALGAGLARLERGLRALQEGGP